VALTVRNLEQSERWYRDVFGLEEVRREASEHRQAVVLETPDGTMKVGLVQHAGTKVGRFDPTVVGLDHAAWSVASRAELDEWQAALEAKGVEHSPIADVGPVAILIIKDPDGIALALFWDRPSTEMRS
jgi:glyoxylase I family protein